MFADIKITDPVFLRNLIIYPITKERENGFNPSTIDKILTSGKGEFLELATPDINRITFENRGDSPSFMLDGEEIIGSLQNRIITTSNLVEARASKDISVICVEEERWDEIGGFQTGHCSYPKIRTILAKSFYKKIDTQRVIWNEIKRKLTVTKTLSTTSSMHDIYNNLENEIARYLEDFKSLNHNTVGFIGIAGNRILGCDIFLNQNIYNKVENKLIRSYALDAIEYQRTKGDLPDVEKFFTGIITTLKKKKFRGKTKNIKIRGDGFSGQSLVYQDKVIHISTFPG